MVNFLLEKLNHLQIHPPHAQEQIFLVVSLDGLREYKDILLAKKWEEQLRTKLPI